MVIVVPVAVVVSEEGFHQHKIMTRLKVGEGSVHLTLKHLTETVSVGSKQSTIRQTQDYIIKNINTSASVL